MVFSMAKEYLHLLCSNDHLWDDASVGKLSNAIFKILQASASIHVKDSMDLINICLTFIRDKFLLHVKSDS